MAPQNLNLDLKLELYQNSISSTPTLEINQGIIFVLSPLPIFCQCISEKITLHGTGKYISVGGTRSDLLSIKALA